MSSASDTITGKKLTEYAQNCGLLIVGTTDLTPIVGARKSLEKWQNSGFAADMRYMCDDPDVYVSPSRLCGSARSMVMAAVYYDRGEAPALGPGQGRVARYAWGKDYHKVLRRKLRRLVHLVEENCGREVTCRIFSDSVPLLERAYAERAGLGFFGKNSLLIRPAAEGSYFFLAEIIWDVEVVDSALSVISGNCGSCVRCRQNCPTGAIVEDYQVDSSRCISYLTIEKRGALSLWEREALGEWVFGCDVCQDVCPFNHAALNEHRGADLEELGQESGAGPVLDLAAVLSLASEEDFLSRFAGTALMRTKREGLLRNAAVVAANTAAECVTEALLVAHKGDSSAMVRQHALWALSKLEHKCNNLGGAELRRLIENALMDPSLLVVNEARTLMIGEG